MPRKLLKVGIAIILIAVAWRMLGGGDEREFEGVDQID